MRFTVRLQDDRYLDMEFSSKKGILYIHSPVPHLTKYQLGELANILGWKIILKMTDEEIVPLDIKDTLENTSDYYRLCIVFKMLSMVVADR